MIYLHTKIKEINLDGFIFILINCIKINEF
jgi:hypothetical protein